MKSFNIVAADRHETLAGNARLAGPDDRRSVSRSATRALDILELLGAERRPLRAVDIARALQLQSSTVDQLLKTMVDSSHLLFDARRKTYMVSPRLLGFSAYVLESYFGDDRIVRLLDEAHAASGALVTLATPRDLSMQVIDFRAADDCPYDRHRGMRAPMFGSASGAAYLSTLPRTQVAELLSRARLQAGFAEPFLESLARVKAQGYAFGGLTDAVDPRSLVVPLPMSPGQPPLTIGLTDDSRRLEPRKLELVGMLRAALARWR